MARKYKQGKLIESVAQFEQWVNAGNNFVIVNTRTTHIGWCISRQYNYLKNVIGRRWMYEAIKTDTDKEVNK